MLKLSNQYWANKITVDLSRPHKSVNRTHERTLFRKICLFYLGLGLGMEMFKC